jgi:hypothetical protein
MSTELDLALGLLDHQLLDSEGRRCGKIDDLAIEGSPGERAEVVALLVGPYYWRGRAGLIGRLSARLGGDSRHRISWEEVADVGADVRLKKKAADYGLGRGDDRVRPWVEWIPGSRR